MVVALALDAAGVGRDAIIADYLATRERIDAIMARLVSSSTYRAELEGRDPQTQAPIAETMKRVLEILDGRFGGPWRGSRGMGSKTPMLERLRRRLAPVGAGARLA